MSQFGKTLRQTRELMAFRSRLTQMTPEDHMSERYKEIDAVELHYPRFQPGQTPKETDAGIREMPELSLKLITHAKPPAEKWDFQTNPQGLIACNDDGCFNVSYFTRVTKTLEETHPDPPMMLGGHPNIKRGPYPSGPEKKY